MYNHITEEDLERLQQEYEKNKMGRCDPDYKPIEGYEHLNVFQQGKRYKVEYEDISITVPKNRVDKTSLSNLIEDYQELEDFNAAHRLNYASESVKAKEFRPLLEKLSGLSSDLSKLAEELDPTS